MKPHQVRQSGRLVGVTLSNFVSESAEAPALAQEDPEAASCVVRQQKSFREGFTSQVRPGRISGIGEACGQLMDIVDRATRSRMMGAIRGKDTKPELAVRRLAHRMGYRFRLHRRDLAGSPDLVFPGRRKVIFVHGCYWHRHQGCRFAYSPKSNAEFWNAKFAGNVARDAEALARLKADGWEPLVIWECESTDADALAARLSAHLEAPE